MKDIVLVIYSTKPGGIELQLSKTIRDLKQYFFSLYALRPVDSTYPNVFTGNNITIYEGSKNNLLLFLKFFLFALRNRNKTFHHFNSGPVILFLTKLAGIKKIIYSIRGTLYWYNKPEELYLKLFWKLAVSKKIVFTANSNYSKDIFKKIVSPEVDPIILYNAFDLSRYKYRLKNREENLMKICYVGRLAKGKNLHAWIDAAEYLIKNSDFSFKFSLYGIGPLKEELERYINNKQLSSVIELKGFITEPESVYYKHDLLLFLSEYESFGNVVVESILCGTPVIASGIPSHKEIFYNYPEFLVPLDDCLNENIYNKINDYNLILEKTKSAYDEFSERFSLKKHYKKLSEIYNGL